MALEVLLYTVHSQDTPFLLWARHLQEQTPLPFSPCHRPHPEALLTHD